MLTYVDDVYSPLEYFKDSNVEIVLSLRYISWPWISIGCIVCQTLTSKLTNLQPS